MDAETPEALPIETTTEVLEDLITEHQTILAVLRVLSARSEWAKNVVLSYHAGSYLFPCDACHDLNAFANLSIGPQARICCPYCMRGFQLRNRALGLGRVLV